MVARQNVEERRRRCVENLHFRDFKAHLALTLDELVLAPSATGDMMDHLGRMVDAAQHDTAAVSFLIHLNIAKQCHNIASTERLHVSRWIAQLRQDHREEPDWNRRFRSLANDVLLLWNVFRYPCLNLLEIGYTSANRPGGLRDIVQSCEGLIEDEQPLPEPIRLAQAHMFKYKLRFSMSFPIDRVGDGNGISGVRVIAVHGWTDEGDVPVNDQRLEALLWTNIETKLGRRQNLPGTLHRCRLVCYDTQEVCQEVACYQQFAEQGRQWLETKLSNLRGNVPVAEAVLLLDVYDVDQYGRLLADVRGIGPPQQVAILQRWSFAVDCVRAGWAYATPRFLLPDAVAAALEFAKSNRVGAWGLETPVRPFRAPYHCRIYHREQRNRDGRRREYWAPL